MPKNSLSDNDDDDEDEDSLTRVVITQIEEHKQRIENKVQPVLPEKTKMPLEIINNKLNVTLNYFDSDECLDDIYDVPSSRSLINLVNTLEMTLPTKQQHCGPNSDITYYHTSSPNLLSYNKKTLLAQINDDEEESIYDTPKSRSFVA